MAGSGIMKQMMISMFIMYVGTQITNFMFGIEEQIVCEPGKNDYGWQGGYKPLQLYDPQHMHRESRYITMKDGTEIAADIYIPGRAYREYVENGADVAPLFKLPTIIFPTHLQRKISVEFPMTFISEVNNTYNPRTKEYIEAFQTSGYAWVQYEVRGVGASTGTKTLPFESVESEDAKEIIDWVISNGWSNGQVHGFGLGVDGVGALYLGASQHPAIKSLILNGVPLDLYEDVFYPGGLKNYKAIEAYSGFTESIRDHTRWEGVSSFKSKLILKHFGGDIIPVNDDKETFNKAKNDQKKNPVFETLVENVQFKDDILKGTKHKFSELESSDILDKIKSTNTSVLIFSVL